MQRFILAAAAAAALAAPGCAAARQGPDLFADADANRDGVVTLAEFQEARADRFNKLDRDRDGVVRMSDFPAFFQSSPRGQQLQRMIGMADANQDGALTRNELLKSPAVAFTAADLDRDGRVTTAEAAAARSRAEQMRATR